MPETADGALAPQVASRPLPIAGTVLPRRRGWWRRCLAQGLLAWRRILAMRDTPHRIALGSAIGVFIAWLPLMGIQLLLGAVVARCCRANVLASVPWSFITNPLTAVPFYYAHYRLGALIWPTGAPVTWSRFHDVWQAQHIDASADGWAGTLWRTVTDGMRLLGDVFVPTAIGTVLVGIPVSIVVYRIVRARIARHQRRHAVASNDHSV